MTQLPWHDMHTYTDTQLHEKLLCTLLNDDKKRKKMNKEIKFYILQAINVSTFISL